MPAGRKAGSPAVSVFGRTNVNEIIFIVSEPPEGGYAAEALGQSIFTVADTLEELNEIDDICLQGWENFEQLDWPRARHTMIAVSTPS